MRIKNATLLGASLLLFVLCTTSCQGPRDRASERVLYGPVEVRYAMAEKPLDHPFHWITDWARYTKPDLVPVNMKVCRSPQGMYMRWDVLVTLQNQDGNAGLDTSEAPVDIYVHFDGSRPYGVDNETGEPLTLEEYDEALLQDMPEQHWMFVPKAGDFGGVAFSLLYPEGGPGSVYRRIPTSFTVHLDQYRGNNPTGGVIDESDEGNNGVGVIIDRYDEINGRTGTYLIGCWYSE